MSVYQRHRTRGGYAAAPTYENWNIWTTCAQSVWTNVSNPSALLTPGSYETMDDVITPDFRRKVARGEILFNPMMKTKRDNLITDTGTGYQYTAITPINCSGVNRRFSLRYEGPVFAALLVNNNGIGGLLPVIPVLSDSDTAGLQDEVSTKCLSNRGRAGSNLFESIAEIKQTFRLLKDPFNSVHKLLRGANTLKGKGVPSAEVWRQYRFGFLPLVRDIGTIVSGLKKKTGKMRVTARANGMLSRYSRTTHTMGTGAPGSVVTYAKSNSDSVSVRATALDEYVVSLFDNIGLSAKNLVTLPWELIPYSFVVDWFANVGDYLGAIVPLPSVKSLGSCLVTTRVQQTLWDHVGTTAPTNFTLDRPFSGQCKSATSTTTRTTILQPSLQFNSDFHLTEPARFADACALITQRMNRIFS